MAEKLSRRERRELENRFEKEIIDNYNEFRKSVPKGDRSGIRWRGQITIHGGVGAAKRFMRSTGNRSAVLGSSWPTMNKLWSLEWSVARPIYKPLFTDEERAEARRRLKLMQP